MTHASAQFEAKPAPAELVVAQCRSVLAQCAGFVRTIGDDDFNAPSDRLFGATIGQHLRHTLDHYAAALAETGQAIDYDRRERGGAAENDRNAALARIDDVAERLCGLSPAACGRSVSIRVMLTAAGDEAVLPSTFARELAFASHHAIHHMAMMAAIAEERGRPIPSGFGKAPSTLQHEGGGGA